VGGSSCQLFLCGSTWTEVCTHDAHPKTPPQHRAGPLRLLYLGGCPPSQHVQTVMCKTWHCSMANPLVILTMLLQSDLWPDSISLTLLANAQLFLAVGSEYPT
jgi:hypothetical protein